jgi:hypothetical protein
MTELSLIEIVLFPLIVFSQVSVNFIWSMLDAVFYGILGFPA